MYSGGFCYHPKTYNEFGQNIPGKIFRYNNGDISIATGLAGSLGRSAYDTDDDNPWRPSTIDYYTDRRVNDDGQVVRLTERTWVPLQCYSTITMYNCGPFAPCLFKPGDASDGGDPLTSEYGTFHMMHFATNNSGVSRVSTNGGTRKVAGNNSTWVGSLVPENYNDRRTSQVSTGLGGEFCLLIGLMALAQDRGKCDKAFTDPKWDRKRHPASEGISSLSGPYETDEPRGVVVEIAHEIPDGDGNLPVGNNDYEIHNFEWFGIAVREL
ncbi:hypothetical protein PG994_014076 [Apiospora phragmitis]|uniref:Uncharacterized protein n=1 Tax=Apiospora phragmitis TaxID=2905665 RepID=A0ABR1T3C3_9PEZI